LPQFRAGATRSKRRSARSAFIGWLQLEGAGAMFGAFFFHDFGSVAASGFVSPLAEST
jgi:hypothetical protein